MPQDSAGPELPKHLQDELLACVARHFEGSRIEDGVVRLDATGLAVRPWVNGVGDMGGAKQASVFMEWWGGRLGEAPIFVSVSGYAKDTEDDALTAVITGACNWCCVFGPLIRAAHDESVDISETDVLSVEVHGQRFRALVDGLDRSFSTDGSDPSDRPAAARERLGGRPYFLPEWVESGRLPVLPKDRVSLVSTFVADGETWREVEVKVNGADWHGTRGHLDGRAAEPPGGLSTLRELAVLISDGPAAPLSRGSVESTLTALSEAADSAPLGRLTWPTWRAHEGGLRPVADERRIRDLELQVGSLPEGYRRFLAQVAESGAGPGYGLLSPWGSEQLRLSRGRFEWVDGSDSAMTVRGVLALAHAGCGITWLLVLAGDRRGEVWVDARSSDGRLRRAAPDFETWYREWLEAVVRGHRWEQWDGDCCAFPAMFSKYFDAKQAQGLPDERIREQVPRDLGEGSLRAHSGGSEYFNEQDLLDPCESCLSLTTELGLPPAAFLPGLPPLQGRLGQAGANGPGFLGRLFGKR